MSREDGKSHKSEKNSAPKKKNQETDAAFVEQVSQIIENELKNFENAGVADYLRSELKNKISKISTKEEGAPIAIANVFNEYSVHDLLGSQKTKNLLSGILGLLKTQNTATEHVVHHTTHEKHKSVGENNKILEEVSIQENSIVFNHNGDPVLIKKIDRETGKVEVMDEDGLLVSYNAENKIDDNFSPDSDTKYLVLKSGKRSMGLSLSEPQLEELSDGVSLEIENNITIDIDPGDTFLDGKKHPWKVLKIVENPRAIILEIENEKNEKETVALTKWEYNKNRQEVLKTLGNKIMLFRDLPEIPEEPVFEGASFPGIESAAPKMEFPDSEKLGEADHVERTDLRKLFTGFDKFDSNRPNVKNLFATEGETEQSYPFRNSGGKILPVEISKRKVHEKIKQVTQELTQTDVEDYEKIMEDLRKVLKYKI